MKSIIFSIFFLNSIVFSQWSALGSGTNGNVYTIHSPGGFYTGSIVTGGAFSTAGGFTAKHVAMWDGSTWSSQYGAIGTDADVKVMILSGLYLGGLFYHAGGDTIFQVASHIGNNWYRLGYGLGTGGVYAMLISRETGRPIAGGSFCCEYWRDTSLHNIAAYNGNSWEPIGSGFNLGVNALTYHNGELIAAGAFTSAGSVSVNRIAKWNGNTWQPLGSGMDLPVHALTVYNGELIAGGVFTTAGGVSAKYIAKWNGSAWTSLGTGVNNGTNNVVKALIVYRGNLIVGGFFDRAGGAPAGYIAKWNGSVWSTLSGGMDGPVYAFDKFKGLADTNGTPYELYAGGEFTAAGGNPASNIAKIREIDTAVKGEIWPKNSINKTIPPHGTVSDTVNVIPHDISSFYTNNVTVIVDSVIFPVDSELEFFLLHQSVTDTIIYHSGANGSNFIGTVIDDSSPISINFGTAPFTGSYIPFSPLSRFNNSDPSGNWILKIYNNGTLNTGMLKAWSLNVGYSHFPIGIQPISNETPSGYSLSQNYPNPFNPATVINFQLKVNSFTTLKIFDVLGREAVTLVNEQLKTGKYKVDWDASGFSSGVYFYELKAGNFRETRKMILLK